MEYKAKISIGMPVLNGEKFISSAIESILGQSFKDFELIISDNKSTDNTGQICRTKARIDKRITFFCQKKRLNVIENFKFVFDASKADYFMWAASDDLWSKNWLQLIYPIAKRYNCIAFGKLIQINAEGIQVPHLSSIGEFDFDGSSLQKKIKFALINPYFGKANLIYSVFPRKAINNAAIKILSTKTWGSDMKFLMHTLSSWKIKTCKKAFFYKRITDSPKCNYIQLVKARIFETVSTVKQNYLGNIWILLLVPVLLIVDIIKFASYKKKYG